MDYLKIGKASELAGKDRKLYRKLEMLPGFLSWGTLIGLAVLSYFYPVFVAYFIIAFDVYWLLLVAFLAIYLVAAYREMQKNMKIDWKKRCKDLDKEVGVKDLPESALAHTEMKVEDILQLVVFPTVDESLNILRPSFQALIDDGFPTKQMYVVLATEGRAGEGAQERAAIIREEFGHYFKKFVVTVHPDGIEGEIKGKGSNQAWAAVQIRKDFEEQRYNTDNILVSVFDMDTIITAGYFHCLTYKFLTVASPYRASYQPIPVYHNNVWEAPFFARVAASSNTFWQMMQQIRQEKLATYSSHSMTWRALNDIGFWSKTMVSEDSRIFWHCFCYYDGDYRVEPMHFPVSMDATMDETMLATARNLYKQQRRWGWGVENLPYLIFNAIKRWDKMDRRKTINRIFVQIHGFHSWATNALIIAVIGWLPMILGGDKFNASVLSVNLPGVTRTLMMMAMGGLVLSSIMSTMLLPKRPKKYGVVKSAVMLLQWLLLPMSIVIFGAIPGMEAQTRLMMGKYLGFFVTPKSR